MNKVLREAFIQARLIEALERSGDYVLRIRSCDKPGIPDILVFPKDRNEKPYFVEVKSKNGVVRPLQHFRARELKKYGIKTLYVNDWRNGPVETVFSDEEIERILDMGLDDIIIKLDKRQK